MLPEIKPGDRSGVPPKIPLLSGARYVLGGVQANSVTAWRQAVETYRDFRQKVGFARNHGSVGNRPGRSKWPEPDALRRVTGKHAPGHDPVHLVDVGFPRSDLGLPMIFHFKDASAGDPKDTALEGPQDGMARFASPVITKAVAVGAGKYRPLILVLNAPHAWECGALRLRDQSTQRVMKTILEVQISLTPDERAQIPPLNGKSVREALLDFAAREWSAREETAP